MNLLPKEPTVPKSELSDFNTIIYGPPKIGKTTLASRFPGAVFLATEDGQNAIECFRVLINTWDNFLDACGELLEGDHPYKTVIVDTVDNLWELARRYICDKRGIEHESELAYGLGSELVRTEFFRALTKLSMLSYGLVLISHSVTREITTRTGKYDRAIPSFKEREQGRLLGMADFILYCDLVTVPDEDGAPQVHRVIRTKTSEAYVSGDRTGRLPDPLPLDFEVFKQEFDEAVACYLSGPADEAGTVEAVDQPAESTTSQENE